MTTKIDDEATLKSAASLVHDARFTADEVEFDELQQTFRMTCWIVDPNRREHTTLWKACQLSFNNITGCQINITEKVRFYEISTLRYMPEKQTVHIVTHYGVDISLQFDNLNGILSEIEGTREHWD